VAVQAAPVPSAGNPVGVTFIPHISIRRSNFGFSRLQAEAGNMLRQLLFQPGTNHSERLLSSDLPRGSLKGVFLIPLRDQSLSFGTWKKGFLAHLREGSLAISGTCLQVFYCSKVRRRCRPFRNPLGGIIFGHE
jgi:hypothetical protein